ncbi:MAG TPA: hypothetical protein PK047_09140 [Saprospiraceae bacterium]|jgi:DNA-binding transcriptional regulator GbsR (MarR family)|nr:hypothetical protein [Saprospiraceae bacterium]HRP42246.1 hypothetical protein [Saprospiraceae bacterium]
MQLPDQELIEDFANYFETQHNFSPLTSKIYSYMLVGETPEGTTFDALVEVFKVSKSSVSNSLNFLTQLRYIEYYSKMDQRKRLYRIAQSATLIRLEKIHEILKLEKKLSERFLKFLVDKTANSDDLRIFKIIYICRPFR